MRPRPQQGQGWRKGGEYFLKKGFLQSSFFAQEKSGKKNLTLSGASLTLCPPPFRHPPYCDSEILPFDGIS
jgi:hypothetical protein